MRRILRIFGVLFLLVGGIAAIRRGDSPKSKVKIPVTRYHGYALNRAAIERARAFTVLISNEGFGGVGRGTGIIVDPIHVLTCAHMVQGPQDDLWIFPYSTGKFGFVVKGRPVFVNKAKDLAILELSVGLAGGSPAEFEENHYDGEPITIIGNTLGAMRWFVTFGILSGEWEGFLLTDGLLYGGNSGGPWINESGKVVAMTDWTLVNHGKESGIHGGIPASTIQAFLNDWRKPTFELHFQINLSEPNAHKSLTIRKEKNNA